ncbi:hypothetical protein CTAM01_03535, partial [Colletotrichum tamarilloi]
SVTTQTAAPLSRLLPFFPRKTPISTANLVLGIPASRPSRASPILRTASSLFSSLSRSVLFSLSYPLSRPAEPDLSSRRLNGFGKRVTGGRQPLCPSPLRAGAPPPPFSRMKNLRPH